MEVSEALDLSELEPEFTRNPYLLYSRLRESVPVCRVILQGLPAWLVTRYDDVRQALADPRLSHDRANASPNARAAEWLFADERLNLQHHMLRSDPPKHTRIRRLAAQAFTASRIAALRPRIQQIADELVDRFAPLGEVELISGYAFPLPLMVIMEILGVPPEDRERLHQWSDRCSAGSAAPEGSPAETLTHMRDYFADLIARKRLGTAGCEGLLDAMVSARDQDDRLDDSELLSSAFQLLQGGHITTLGLIANGLLALLPDPARLAALKANPDLVGRAVDEFLRFESPMEIATVRFTTREVVIGGVTIPAGGEPVIVSLASANRDPSRFDHPDSLDFARDSSSHLAFGHGAHACLGASLARTEAQIAFRTLLTRLDDLALAVAPSELAWRPNPHLRRPERLPITFTVRAE